MQANGPVMTQYTEMLNRSGSTQTSVTLHQDYDMAVSDGSHYCDTQPASLCVNCVLGFVWPTLTFHLFYYLFIYFFLETNIKDDFISKEV